jgi:hypothetical protein
MALATFLAIFSQTHLVTLIPNHSVVAILTPSIAKKRIAEG